MGMQSAQIAQPMNQPSGKGSAPMAPRQIAEETNMAPAVQNDGQTQSFGKGGSVTFPSQGGQPRMGKPNNYSNTVGPWDNSSIQPRQTQSGKGKGY